MQSSAPAKPWQLPPPWCSARGGLAREICCLAVAGKSLLETASAVENLRQDAAYPKRALETPAQDSERSRSRGRIELSTMRYGADALSGGRCGTESRRDSCYPYYYHSGADLRRQNVRRGHCMLEYYRCW